MKDNKLQPKLRFKEFNGDWEETKYGNIYSFFSTNSLSRDNLNYKYKNVKNIHYGDIHTKFKTMFDIKNEKVPFINQDVDISKIKESSYCQKGDLIIADASEDYKDIGKTIEITNLNNEKLVAGLHTFLARPEKNIMFNGFMGNLLKSWKIRKEVMRISQGTKVLSLSTTRLKELNLIFPSTEEQEKIANFLSSVDNKIEKLEKKKSLLEQYKKGVMQKIFNQEIRFKDENGNSYPNWEEKKLGEIAIFSKGKNISKADVTKEGLECIRYGELYTKYKENINQIISKTNLDKQNLIFSEGNEILIPASGETAIDLATASYLSKPFVAIGGDINIIKSSENGLFLSYYMNNKKKLEIASLSQGSSVIHIYNSQLKSLKLNIPQIEEQEKIAKFLSSIDSKIEITTNNIEKNKEFKKGLLQQMFC